MPWGRIFNSKSFNSLKSVSSILPLNKLIKVSSLWLLIIDFSNFGRDLKKSESIESEDSIGEIKILKKEDESYRHFIINILNAISTYSQLIELCLNRETNQTLEEINLKIKIYSTEIKNNSQYLSKILKNMEIKEENK